MTLDLEKLVVEIAQNARRASQTMATVSTTLKNRALAAIAHNIERRKDFIQQQNKIDLEQAWENGLSKAMIDRLTLSDGVIKAITEGLHEVIALPDPVGKIEYGITRPNGLKVSKMRVPLGVIGMIYESRPNVTADAAGLCLKTGNACILRGGSEAFHSNVALAKIICDALGEAGLPEHAVQVLPVTDREAVNILLKQEAYVDLIIPRGGEGLIRNVVENSSIPVLKHYKGVCHIFVDNSADFNMAADIIVNSKAQRPSACNSAETVLVHKDAAQGFLPQMHAALQQANVKVLGDEKAKSIVPAMEAASDADWGTEYLDYKINVKVVDNLEDAVAHIRRYNSNHTDVIVTESYNNAQEFIRSVDASMVGVNASTRFNDGNQLGLGAEIGISTSKLHAYGPMGLEELTTTKFVVMGSGQVRP